VVIDIEPVALRLCQPDNRTRSQGGHHDNGALSNTVFLGVFVGELIQLVVSDGHKVAIGHLYSHVLILVAEDQASL